MFEKEVVEGYRNPHRKHRGIRALVILGGLFFLFVFGLLLWKLQGSMLDLRQQMKGFLPRAFGALLVIFLIGGGLLLALNLLGAHGHNKEQEPKKK